MSVDRWRVDELCDAALERRPEDRAAFLEEACAGDAALRREVESLLEHTPAAAGFLETPLGAVAAAHLDASATRIGERIGPYEITGRLGAGGMGEVYRARDTVLGRDVAIKALPSTFVSDPERMARLQREARALAALNHPNVATIYGVELAGGARVLVLELVEGDTVADRLARGQLEIEEALSLARQMIDALDAAHEKGIVHRDLKPANVKVTPAGVVKVLDFGLATAGSSGPQSTLAETTPKSVATADGVLLGTAAYMSPEQARGLAVDSRADVWAFGCVLYEMLTGRSPFGGETISDTLAAVLTREPDWTRLPPSTPLAVRRLLHYCLARDRGARLRAIADARCLLDDALAAQPTPGPPVRRPGLRVAVPAAAAAVALFLLGWSVARRNAASFAPAVRRATVQLPTSMPDNTSGGGAHVAMASDGGAIAFVGRSGSENRLFVHRLADASTIALPLSRPAHSMVFSPDGRWLAFASTSAIWRASVDGGAAEMLCSSPAAQFRGGAWSDDGRIVFGSTTGLFEVGKPGEPCRLVVALDSRRETRFMYPDVLPRGRGILLTVSGASDSADGGSIVAVTPGSDERRVIVPRARAARLAGSRHLLFARGDQILAAPFDLDRLAITGDPKIVQDHVASGQFGEPVFSVSKQGDLVYEAGGATGSRLSWVRRDGTRVDVGAPPRSYQEAYLSPDGRHIAASIGTADHFLWLFSVESGTFTLVADRDAHSAVWSPDGRRLVFPMYGTGLAIKGLDDAGQPVVAVQIQTPVAEPVAWSPDGSTILYSERAADAHFNLRAFSLLDKTSRTLVTATSTGFSAQFSPDGRWLAYSSPESGRLEVYVTDFPEAQTKKAVSTDGGFAPAWARDGRELFYVSDTWMMSAAVRPGSPIAFERPQRLFDGIVPSGGSRPFSVAPDGRFLVVSHDGDEADAFHRRQLTLVLNWFDEWTPRVPVASR